MRRLVLALSLLVACVLFASESMAQRACVLAPQGDVVCGPVVQPGYRPPPRDYREPRYYDGRRDYDDRRYRDDDRRGPPAKCQPGYTVQDGVCKPYRPPPTCQPGYTVQGGKCKPYRAPPTCQPGYTVQDGVCKPYTGR